DPENRRQRGNRTHRRAITGTAVPALTTTSTNGPFADIMAGSPLSIKYPPTQHTHKVEPPGISTLRLNLTPFPLKYSFAKRAAHTIRQIIFTEFAIKNATAGCGISLSAR